MTDLELFNKVKTHLLTQNKKATQFDEGDCWYRYNGLMCAAGCLIDNRYYNEDLEGQYIGVSTVKTALLKSGIKEEQIALIKILQRIHDDSHISDWPSELERIRNEFGLSEG